MASNALLLFLSANNLQAQLMSRGRVTARHTFSDTAEGLNEFASFLRECNQPAYLLVDLIEEDFRQETVPHLIGRNRTALLQRKFEQFYRNTPFRQASLLQRQKTGRRDDDLLFSALTNPALLAPWLTILQSNRIPLAGIYSVPRISTPLVKDHPSDYLLLISWEQTAGLRQTYFSNHRLQISRLTPANVEQSFRETVLRELPRTYQYLKSLSLLPAGQTLDIRLLCHRDDLIELQTLLPPEADMHYDFVDLETLARQLGIEQRFADSDATQIFLHQLAARPPKNQYANTEHRHYYDLWRLRHMLNLTGSAILAAACAWSAADIWQSSWLNDETQALNHEARLLQNQTQQIAATFPKSDVHASDMKSSVSIMHFLERQDLPADAAMLPLSQVLDHYPRIELDEFGWKSDASEAVTDGQPNTVPAQVLHVNGHLLDFGNDYRAALGYLEQFEHALEKLGYRVTVVRKPLDLSPGGDLSDRREATDVVLEFSLKLVRRQPT